MLGRSARTVAWLVAMGLVAGCGGAGDVSEPDPNDGLGTTQAALTTTCTLDVQAQWDGTQTDLQFTPTCVGNMEHYVIQFRDGSGKLVLLEVSPPGFSSSKYHQLVLGPHLGNQIVVQAKLGKGTPGGGDIGWGKGGIFGKGTPGGGDLGWGKGGIFGKGTPGGGDSNPNINGETVVVPK